MRKPTEPTVTAPMAAQNARAGVATYVKVVLDDLRWSLQSSSTQQPRSHSFSPVSRTFSYASREYFEDHTHRTIDMHNGLRELPVPLILLVALVARVIIIWSGGQFYWPDEDRYRESRAIVAVLKNGETHAPASVEHHLFKVIGRLPAAIESMYRRDARIPATFFALFSVVNIWLLAGIARQLGADTTESGLAALLFAASTSFLYFTRHLLPYDVAMTFGLLALRAGTAREASSRASFICGAWATVCFLSYFGYWTLGGAACAVHVLYGGRMGSVRRGVVTTLGLATPLLLFVGLPYVVGGNVVAGAASFMADVNQGAYSEGWRVPFEYLWHAEHGLFVLWLVAVATCVVGWRRWRDVPAVRAGLIGLLFVYGTLAVLSTGLAVFVVYGRLARQLVPFFCLVAAAVLARAAAHTSRRRGLLIVASAAIVIQAALNGRQVIAQQFPPGFIRRGERVVDRLGAADPIALYAVHLYPPAKLETPAGYIEVFSAPHPLQFKPYQYEGYTPQERAFLRSTDIRMRILVPAVENP